MILLDENKKSLDITVGDFINEGCFGKVFHLPNGNCLKVYKKFLSNSPEQTLRVLRDNKFNNFYKVNKIYFNPLHECVGGYEMKYYETEKVDLFTIESDYLVDSYKGLLKDIEILSRNGISMCDFYFYNMLLTKNGIVAIDADCYNSLRNMGYERTYLSNLYQLKMGIIDLISSQYHNSTSIDKKSVSQGEFDSYLYRLVQPSEVNHNFSKVLSKERNIRSYIYGA